MIKRQNYRYRPSGRSVEYVPKNKAIWLLRSPTFSSYAWVRIGIDQWSNRVRVP